MCIIFSMLKYFDDSHNIATLTQPMAWDWRQDYLFVQPMEDRVSVWNSALVAQKLFKLYKIFWKIIAHHHHTMKINGYQG